MEVKVFEVGTAGKEAEQLGGADGVGERGLCDVERGEVKWVDGCWRGESGSCYLHGYMTEGVCSAGEEDVAVVGTVCVKGGFEADVEVVKDATGGGEGEIGEPSVERTPLERHSAVHPAGQVGKKARDDWKEAVIVCEVYVDVEGEGR